MAKKGKEYRECEECGEPIESGNPTVRLCKRCAVLLQDKRRRDGFRHRPKDYKKKKKKRGEEDYYEDYEEEYM